jgi:putative transposase
MVHELQNRGIDIGERHTGTLMRRMGIGAIYPQPALSYNKREHIPYPYLLTNLTVERANQVWATDITYVKMIGGYMYLTAVLDWWSRYVVSWELSNTLTTDFCVSAIKKGLNHGKPEIMNSDQGVQFTSQAYINVLTEHDIKISMDHKGRCFDNIFVERLWRTIKYEEVYLHEYDSPRDARQSLTEYIGFYNTKRYHQALGYKTPEQVYFQTESRLH